jgi:peptide deformylase
MAVKKVLRMGNPLLLRKAEPVTKFNTPELHALITDMQDTMEAMNGAGIAAPQIGESLRVVIFGVGANPRYPDAEEVPYTVLINPTLTLLGDSVEDGWEGCLSVPGLRGMVPRHTQLHYTGFDLHGNKIDRLATGFHARVVQHECDHLDGFLYPMRIKNFNNFGYIEEIFPNQDIPED